jgi:hypothetical protein
VSNLAQSFVPMVLRAHPLNQVMGGRREDCKDTLLQASQFSSVTEFSQWVAAQDAEGPDFVLTNPMEGETSLHLPLRQAARWTRP